MEQSNKGIEGLRIEALSIPERAGEIKVEDQISLDSALEILKVCKLMRRKIDDLMDPIIKRDNDMHKADLEQKRALKAPILTAEDIVKPQVASYRRKLEDARWEAEEKARRAIEAKKKEEEELLKKALKAEEKGEVEEAEDLLEEAVAKVEEAPQEVTDLKSVPKAPDPKGTTLRKVWKYRITDPEKVPREFMILDEKKIGFFARTYKGSKEIPGIEIYSEDILY